MKQRVGDQIHRLPDGRALAYAEYGDAHGTPVLLVHGNPGSRLFWGLHPDSPFRSGLRLIAPDRPGVGLSDFGPGRTVADWPDDVVSLADALGIQKFVVFGPSGGGPYALACAWKIPHRLTAVGLFAPMGPYLPETVEGLVPSLAKLYRVAPRFPRLVRVPDGAGGHGSHTAPCPLLEDGFSRVLGRRPRCAPATRSRGVDDPGPPGVLSAVGSRARLRRDDSSDLAHLALGDSHTRASVAGGTGHLRASVEQPLSGSADSGLPRDVHP